jgi:hypothetical protein
MYSRKISQSLNDLLSRETLNLIGIIFLDTRGSVSFISEMAIDISHKI